MYLLTVSGRAGRENIWLEVRTYGSSAARPVRPDLTQSISILSYDLFFVIFIYGGTRPRAAVLLRFESSDFLSVASL